MKVDLAGRVRNTNLPVSRPLLPLFDALINALHAVEDGQPKQGHITIHIDRDRLLVPDETNEPADIVGFLVSDNGIGFDTANYTSFDTSDSTWKEDRGAKGVGRFLWLKAFDDVRVDSVFRDGPQLKSRTFRFTLPNGITDHRTETAPQDAEPGSRVHLLQFRDIYRRNCPRHLESIADRLIDHCLVYLMRPDCPVIVLSDNENSLSLRTRFDERVRKGSPAKKLVVNECELSVQHFHVYEPLSEHRIVYCANQREVAHEKPDSPDLTRRLEDDAGTSFVVASCVSGEVLDRSVNQERTGFNLDDRGDVLPGHLTLENLRDAANHEVVDHLEPYLNQVREAKLLDYRRHIEREAPQYRPLLKRREELLQLPPGLTAEKLDIELHRIRARLEIDTKERVTRLLKDVTTFAEYKEKYEALLEQVNDLGRAALTEHVVHRKLVLEILAKQLGFQDDGRYGLEANVHSIIFPLRSASDDVLFEQQNLWIIDEKLTFHRYLASDQQLSKHETHAQRDSGRPDLVIWNNPFSLTEDESLASLNSVTVIEFKRPQRSAYDNEENPLSQVFEYVRKIKEGRATTHGGRPLNVRESTPFYAYVLCDLTPVLRGLIENFSLSPTPDGHGYFGYNPNLKCYIEVLSYEKMIDDARKRNRAFFEKLQLPSL